MKFLVIVIAVLASAAAVPQTGPVAREKCLNKNDKTNRCEYTEMDNGHACTCSEIPEVPVDCLPGSVPDDKGGCICLPGYVPGDKGGCICSPGSVPDGEGGCMKVNIDCYTGDDGLDYRGNIDKPPLSSLSPSEKYMWEHTCGNWSKLGGNYKTSYYDTDTTKFSDNKCRGTPGYRPWCWLPINYSRLPSGNVNGNQYAEPIWKYCNVAKCTVAENVDCYTGVGLDYRGKVNTTKDGKTCINWEDTASSVRQDYSDRSKFSGNMCRGTSGWLPWCYYDNSADAYGLCEVTKCEALRG